MTTSYDRLKIPNRRRWKLLVIPAAAAGLAGLAACGSSGNSSHIPVAAGSLRVAHVGSATVLTNTRGFTLYSFAPDTPSKSNCNGPCAVKWPPVKGHVAASGIKGTFTAIKRSDGSTQETFDGHPLYTFVGDKAPGQANGNGVNAFGGAWHEITTSGSAPAGGPASTGGGGSGY
jgi:predicted lipoprotein with Yx(FWY)xxD motif